MALAEASPQWVPQDTFGARLALIRQRMGGWNVKRTAEFCGLDDQSWRNWEGGTPPRDYEAVCAKISAATGCDLRWLKAGGPLLTCVSGNRWSDFQLPLIDDNDKPVVFRPALRTVANA